jgi:hypothetical protein
MSRKLKRPLWADRKFALDVSNRNVGSKAFQQGRTPRVSLSGSWCLCNTCTLQQAAKQPHPRAHRPELQDDRERLTQVGCCLEQIHGTNGIAGEGAVRRLANNVHDNLNFRGFVALLSCMHR